MSVDSNNESSRTLLVAGVRELLVSIKPWLDEVSDFAWDGSQGYLTVIRRAALRRQFDTLEVSADLVEAGRGNVAVALLRASCEELLWLRYFEGMDEADGIQLVNCMIASGLLNDLKAQEGEVGRMG